MLLGRSLEDPIPPEWRWDDSIFGALEADEDNPELPLRLLFSTVESTGLERKQEDRKITRAAVTRKLRSLEQSHAFAPGTVKKGLRHAFDKAGVSTNGPDGADISCDMFLKIVKELREWDAAMTQHGGDQQFRADSGWESIMARACPPGVSEHPKLLPEASGKEYSHSWHGNGPLRNMQIDNGRACNIHNPSVNFSVGLRRLVSPKGLPLKWRGENNLPANDHTAALLALGETPFLGPRKIRGQSESVLARNGGRLANPQNDWRPPDALDHAIAAQLASVDTIKGNHHATATDEVRALLARYRAGDISKIRPRTPNFSGGRHGGT